MIRRILLYIILLIGLLTETIAFATAKTYVQLGVATFFYLVLAYAFLELFPRKSKVKQLTKLHEQTTSIGTPYDSHEDENEKVADTDKRAFLHLIFTAGIAFFIYSIVNKRAEMSILGQATGPGSIALEDTAGNKVNPAKEQPTDGYIISDIDDMNPEYIYYGYTKVNGNWYITKQDMGNGSFRYTKGDRDFPAYWNNRAQLNYDYSYNVLA